MPSFDVISKVNYQELDNALANCLREISNRYDFKGLNISFPIPLNWRFRLTEAYQKPLHAVFIVGQLILRGLNLNV